MSLLQQFSVNSSPVRQDYVPKDDYVDPAFAKREADALWPYVWQMICREEELTNVGNFVTLEVGKESIIVVRASETELKAFHNVCLHRGRRLVDQDVGRMQRLTCRFHAWQWNIDGSLRHIPDQDDWQGSVSNCDMGLKPLNIGVWGGFVFINMNPDAEPLKQFLGKVDEVLSPYEFEKMRFRWARTTRMPCNWKVALEAFNEGYHVQGTHRQALQVMDDASYSVAHGPHSMFVQPDPSGRGIGQPATKTGLPLVEDSRKGILDYVAYMANDLKAIFSDRAEEATRRLLTEMPKDASVPEVLGAMIGYWRDAALASGAGWPDLSAEQMAAAGTDWHIFPNLVTLPTPDAAIFYRARPDGTNPDSCFFDIWSLQRYAPGQEPKFKRDYYEKWTDFDDWGDIFTQDFENMEFVQKGMHSRGFTASRPNPKQEIAVSNFHREIHEYLERNK